MALIVLLGRHGSGKSTIGSHLENHGFKHVSVGMIRRLAQSRQFPVDIPVPLLISMKRAKPGQVLDAEATSQLLKFTKELGNCVIDGFPTVIEQLRSLPKETVFIYVGISKGYVRTDWRFEPQRQSDNGHRACILSARLHLHHL
jgi:adenylate kinase family enzyme